MNAKADSRANQQQTGLDPQGYPMDSVPPAAYGREEAQNPVTWAWCFFKQRFWMIASVALIGTVVAAMYGLQRPTLYTATAEIVIDPTDTRVFGLDGETGTLGSDATTLETQIRVARSPDVALAVMDRLGLERQMALQIAAREAEGATLNPALQPFARLLDLLPTDLLIASGLASEVVQLEAVDPGDKARRAALGYLDGGLSVRQSGRSLVLAIGFTANSPHEAARVANAFADAYIDQQLARKVGGTSRAASFLENRVAELQDQLRAKEE